MMQIKGYLLLKSQKTEIITKYAYESVT